MPKKSKKSKSKRVTLAQKYRVQKRVREAKRKDRRSARKLEKQGIKPKGPKDPGLPQQWPFRDELVKEFEFQKRAILAAEAAKKEAKKEARKAKKRGLDPEEEAAQRREMFEAARTDAAAKRARARLATEQGARVAAFKQLKSVIERADVLIQVLDARDPAGCRAPEVERMVAGAGGKRLVNVMNKIDLVPREAASSWLSYLREEAPTLGFKCSKPLPVAKVRLGKKKKENDKKRPADQGAQVCLGGDLLLQLLRALARARGATGDKPLTVGVIGLPAVGKHSIIGSLLRARQAQTGVEPKLDGRGGRLLDAAVVLLEEPGEVDARGGTVGDAVLRYCADVSRITNTVSPVSDIVERAPVKQLMKHYRIGAFSGAAEFLAAVGKATGKMLKGQGKPDVHAASRLVLTDWVTGRIPAYTSAPADPSPREGGKAGKGGTGGKARRAAKSGSDAELDAAFSRVVPLEEAAVLSHLQSVAMPGDADDSDDDGASGRCAAPAAPVAAVSGRRGFFELPSLGPLLVDLDALAALEAQTDAEEADAAAAFESQAAAKRQRTAGGDADSDADEGEAFEFSEGEEDEEGEDESEFDSDEHDAPDEGEDAEGESDDEDEEGEDADEDEEGQE